MPRRTPYTSLEKVGQSRPPGVQGAGQVLYSGFQCPSGGCEFWFVLPKSELEGDYSFTCPACSQSFGRGDSVLLFNYELKQLADDTTIESGVFEMYIDEYLGDAVVLKYCLLCYELKPLSAFSNHSSMASGKQGECRRCKTRYNAIKNQSRTPDQHRDASQKRRLLVDLGGADHFDSDVVRVRYSDHCFKCGKDVSLPGMAAFDHTLPARYLWPMTTQNATLLCKECNGQKGATWPALFYDDNALRTLAQKTGVPYDVLRSTPRINPDALDSLRKPEFVDALFTKYADYMDDVVLIRNRVLELEGFDFFESSPNVSQVWFDKANARRPSQSATTSE